MERKKLLERLEVVAPALSSSELVPVMKHFWFTKDHVVAYNDVISLRVPLTTGFHGAVPGVLLLALLKNSRAKNIEFLEDDNKLILKAASSRLELVTMPPDEFLFEFPALPKQGLVITDKFLEAIKYCLMSAGTDTSVPEQLGVTLVPDKKGLWFYSANHVTLSRSFCPVKKDLPSDQIILPTEYCKQLLRLAQPNKARFILDVDNEAVICDLGNQIGLFGRLVYSPAPSDFHGIVDYHLPKKLSSKLVSVPTKLRLVLERAIVMSSSGVDVIPMKVTVKDAKARFVSEAPDRGRVTDSIRLEERHLDCEIAIDPILMKRGYSFFDEMLFSKGCAIMKKDDHLYLISAIGQ